MTQSLTCSKTKQKEQKNKTSPHGHEGRKLPPPLLQANTGQKSTTKVNSYINNKNSHSTTIIATGYTNKHSNTMYKNTKPKLKI